MVTFCISLTHVNALTWSIITIHPNMSHHSQENRCRFGPCKGHILFSRTHLVISFYAVSFEFEHHHNFKILFLFFQRISSKSSVDDLYINNFPSFKSSKFSLSLSLTHTEIWNLSAKDGGDGRNRSRTSGPFSTFLSSHLLRFFAFCLVAEKNEGNKEIEEKRNSRPFAFRWFWFRKLKNPNLNRDK